MKPHSRVCVWCGGSVIDTLLLLFLVRKLNLPKELLHIHLSWVDLQHKSLFCSDLYLGRCMQVWSSKWAICVWKVQQSSCRSSRGRWHLCCLWYWGYSGRVRVFLSLTCDPYFLLPTGSDKSWYKYISPFQIGETIADKVTGKPLPSIKVEEPTVRMAFAINISPFVGREVYG